MTTQAKLILFAVLALSLIAHGLYLTQPFFTDERPLVNSHIEFVDQGTLVPTIANYPSFYIYLSFPGTLIGVAAQTVLAGYDSLTDATVRMLLTDTGRMALGGRIVTLLCLYLVGWFTWAGLRQFVGDWGAGFAALMVVCTPGLLQYGSYLLPDVPLMMFCLISMILAMRAVSAADRVAGLRLLYFASACAGLAVSTKYNGAAMVLIVATAGVMLCIEQGRIRGGLLAKTALNSAGLCLAAFLLGTPGWLIDPGFFWGALKFEIAHAREGHLVADGVPFLGQIELFLRHTPVIFIAALGGVLWWGIRLRDRVGGIALAVVLAGIFLAAQSSKQSFQYLLIVLPGLLYFAGLAVSGFGGVGRGVASLCVIVALGGSLLQAWPMTRANTSDLARDWLDNNVTPDQTIARAWNYVPGLLSEQQFEKLAKTAEFAEVAAEMKPAQPTLRVVRYPYSPGYPETGGADFILTSSRVFDRYYTYGWFTATPPSPLFDVFRTRKAFYDGLFASDLWRLVFEADTGNGPRTLIYGRADG